MTATHTAPTRTALYYRPAGKGRWRLFDVYPTREEAFRAADQLPDRHPTFRLEDVPAPADETDPTTDPLEITAMLNDKIEPKALTPLSRVTPAELAAFRTRFRKVMQIVGPEFKRASELGRRVLTDELAKVAADLERADASAGEVFASELAKLEENDATE